MALRLLPWSPEYGTSMQFDADEANGGDDTSGVDPTIEGPWQAVTPSGEPPRAVQIIDGVRRAEAHAMDDVPGGGAVFGLFGSLAVGGVRMEDGRARLLSLPGEPVAERRSQYSGQGEEDAQPRIEPSAGRCV